MSNYSYRYSLIKRVRLMGVYHLIERILTIFSMDSMLKIYPHLSDVLLDLEFYTYL